MNQEFADKLSAAGNSRKALIVLIEEIDQTSRSVKANLTRLSSEPREGDPTGRDRQTRIRKMKGKLDHLKTEREVVRNKLASVKEMHRALNFVENTYRTDEQVEYLKNFMVCAVELLDEKQLSEIESRAVSMKSLDR